MAGVPAVTEHLMLMDQQYGVPQPPPGFMTVHLHILCFRLGLHLIGIAATHADLALSRALRSFMRWLFRVFHLVPLQRTTLLTPAIIHPLGHPDLTNSIGNALTLRDQNVNLPQLRGDLLRLVSLPLHI